MEGADSFEPAQHQEMVADDLYCNEDEEEQGSDEEEVCECGNYLSTHGETPCAACGGCRDQIHRGGDEGPLCMNCDITRPSKKRELPQLCDEPDLGQYFAEFPYFDELMQAKYCRAFANMLAAKSERNKTRNRNGAPYVKYSKKQ